MDSCSTTLDLGMVVFLFIRLRALISSWPGTVNRSDSDLVIAWLHVVPDFTTCLSYIDMHI